ncbi:MAG TPA: flagellar biosynthetic protein FliR [Geminicoccus sp.]|jgi:flagellar biosynthetic protein FliR|uniref:flagellar biosynthetic protein FliR n=1 Tax=Geminicoccus sp. TaxID=2024832 RepID=UPI002E301A6E|nr:flagellar biosynthetic protein FliR [Geminicoccus sp.]HEX2529528.1 flagellar biosynthetic protein FliR [Geminicoccus sp.]
MTGALADLVTREVLACALVFARVGTAMMILPMFAEQWLTARARLAMALVVSFVLVPGSGVQAPATPDPLSLFLPVVGEMAIGAFLGLLIRWIFAALHMAGTVIAMHSGLQVAAMFDPNEASQSTIPSALLSMMVLTVLFASDAHHLLLAGLAHSYGVLPFGSLPDLPYMTETMSRAGSQAFDLAFRVAGPVVLATLLLNGVLGVMNRLMPTLQVLFVAAPAQIMVSLIVLAAAVGSIGLLALRMLSVAWSDVLGNF